MLTYKVTKCPKKDCKYFMLSSQFFDDMTDCEYYHFDDDKRRNPFVMVDGKPQYNQPMLYDNTLCETDKSSCLNQSEYMYHPLNFQTMECELDDCSNKFCSFYHTEEEKKIMEKAR